MRWQSRITPDRAVLMGVLFTAAVYCRDLQYSFVLDDNPLIFTNENLASWRNWKIFFRTDIFSASGPSIPLSFSAHYRPIYMLWLMINEQLFGLIVPWWHLTSLLLHICAIYLVYQLGLRVFKEGWTATLGALLFAFHPIHVEAVAYVSASTDLLATIFVLISFLSYCRFREPNASPAYFAVSLLTAGLAMLSKETAAMMPFLLVSYEACCEVPADGQRRWSRFIWTLPFFAIVAIYILLRTLLFGRNLGPGPGFSRWAAFTDAPLVLLAYLRNLSWPRELSFYYPAERVSQWSLGKGVLMALVIAIGIFLWNRYQNRPDVRLQFLWAAILFVPVVTAMAAFGKDDWVHDRHMYLVSVPFCLIAAEALTNLKFARNASLIASTVILAFLFCETAIAVPRFTDEITLYEHALKVAPRNVPAHRYYAFALWSNGDYEGAFREFQTTLELAPGDPLVYGSYADALAEAGHDEEAAKEYATALHWSPKPTPYRAFLLYRLATIEIKHSQSLEGVSHLREALAIAPQTRGYHAMLAQALRQQGRRQEADQEMRLEASLRKPPIREANPLK
jgi:Flp pilus assembly protein TadD